MVAVDFLPRPLLIHQLRSLLHSIPHLTIPTVPKFRLRVPPNTRLRLPLHLRVHIFFSASTSYIYSIFQLYSRPERPDLRLERLDLRPERPDLRPERPDLRPGRLDLRPERLDLRPERPDLRPEGSDEGGGLTNERTNGRTDGRTKVPLCSTGLRPLRGRCPKGKKSRVGI